MVGLPAIHSNREPRGWPICRHVAVHPCQETRVSRLDEENLCKRRHKFSDASQHIKSLQMPNTCTEKAVNLPYPPATPSAMSVHPPTPRSGMLKWKPERSSKLPPPSKFTQLLTHPCNCYPRIPWSSSAPRETVFCARPHALGSCNCPGHHPG
jgi:hypothetical protein